MLISRVVVISWPGGKQRAASGHDDDDTDAPEISGSEARLKWWNERRASDLGRATKDGAAPPLIDCVHRVMQLWKTGEQARVDAYLEERGLWKHELFASVIQAVLELAERGSDERGLLGEDSEPPAGWRWGSVGAAQLPSDLTGSRSERPHLSWSPPLSRGFLSYYVRSVIVRTRRFLRSAP